MSEPNLGGLNSRPNDDGSKYVGPVTPDVDEVISESPEVEAEVTEEVTDEEAPEVEVADADVAEVEVAEAEVTEEAEKTLQSKADDFNKRYKDKLGYGVNLGMLKSVYQRGLGAYNVSHSPEVKSAGQWAQARVNAFLYIVKEGRPENSKYTGDFDLLPKGHPKSDKK